MKIMENFTPIPNPLMNIFMKISLSPNESKILWFILRKTFGFHKEEDRISLSQFSKATGINRCHVSRYLKDLEAKKIIIIKRKRRVNTYSLFYGSLEAHIEDIKNKIYGTNIGTTSVQVSGLIMLPGNAPTKERERKSLNKEWYLSVIGKTF